MFRRTLQVYQQNSAWDKRLEYANDVSHKNQWILKWIWHLMIVPERSRFPIDTSTDRRMVICDWIIKLNANPIRHSRCVPFSREFETPSFQWIAHRRAAFQQVNWNELVPIPESVFNCICDFPKLNSNELGISHFSPVHRITSGSEIPKNRRCSLFVSIFSRETFNSMHCGRDETSKKCAFHHVMRTRETRDIF